MIAWEENNNHKRNVDEIGRKVTDHLMTGRLIITLTTQSVASVPVLYEITFALLFFYSGP